MRVSFRYCEYPFGQGWMERFVSAMADLADLAERSQLSDLNMGGAKT